MEKKRSAKKKLDDSVWISHQALCVCARARVFVCGPDDILLNLPRPPGPDVDLCVFTVDSLCS